MHPKTLELIRHPLVRRHALLAEAHSLAMMNSRRGSESHRFHYEQMSRHNDAIHQTLNEHGRQSPFVNYEFAAQARSHYAHTHPATSTMDSSEQDDGFLHRHFKLKKALERWVKKAWQTTPLRNSER
jgi:hypothetical protein